MAAWVRICSFVLSLNFTLALTLYRTRKTKPERFLPTTHSKKNKSTQRYQIRKTIETRLQTSFLGGLRKSLCKLAGPKKPARRAMPLNWFGRWRGTPSSSSPSSQSCHQCQPSTRRCPPRVVPLRSCLKAKSMNPKKERKQVETNFTLHVDSAVILKLKTSKS